MVQWLRLCTSTAGGTRSIPGQGTRILCAARHGQKKRDSNIVKEEKSHKTKIYIYIVDDFCH